MAFSFLRSPNSVQCATIRPAIWLLLFVCIQVLTAELIINMSHVFQRFLFVATHVFKTKKTRMWANAQRDVRPAEHWWRPLFNAAMFG